MPSRLPLLILASGLLVAGGCWLSSLLVSEETRVRRTLEAFEVHFNEQRSGAFIDGLSDDYREHNHSLGREDVKLIFFRIFNDPNLRTTERKSFLYRAEIDGEAAVVDIDEDAANRATAAFTLRIRRSDAAADADPEWEARFDATLVREEGDWKLRESRYRTQSGRMPF